MAADSLPEAGLVVVGAGLMRTGTTSLRAALQRLLGGQCYHMRSVLEHRDHIRFWLDATRTEPTAEEWRAFFADFRAAVDFPAVAFYRRLLEVFPDARVVLTVRDPHRWFRSVGETVAPAIRRHNRLPWSALNWLTGLGGFGPMLAAVVGRVMGRCSLDDEAAMVALFRRHVAEVREAVPAERLLVFEAGEGWGPLCRFLGVAVPEEPFPHVNTSDEFRRRSHLLSAAQCGLVLAAALAAGAAVYFGRRGVSGVGGWTLPGLPAVLSAGER